MYVVIVKDGEDKYKRPECSERYAEVVTERQKEGSVPPTLED